jgi:hypothetical protein
MAKNTGRSSMAARFKRYICQDHQAMHTAYVTFKFVLSSFHRGHTLSQDKFCCVSPRNAPQKWRRPSGPCLPPLPPTSAVSGLSLFSAALLSECGTGECVGAHTRRRRRENSPSYMCEGCELRCVILLEGALDRRCESLAREPMRGLLKTG